MTEKEQKDAVAIIRDLLGVVDGWAEGTSNSDRTLINDRKNSARSFLADTEDTGGEKCPNCPDQGWYNEPDDKTGEPTPAQCEFCYTNPKSVFNLSRRPPPKEPEEKIEIGGDGVVAPENDHPVFQDYLYHVKPRDRTLSDAFNAGLKAQPKEQDDEAINKFLKRRGIVGPPLTGLVNDCWNEACKWMASKGENQ